MIVIEYMLLIWKFFIWYKLPLTDKTVYDTVVGPIYVCICGLFTKK